VSPTPGIDRTAVSSDSAAAWSRSGASGAQSTIRLPLSLRKGRFPSTSARTVARRPRAPSRRTTSGRAGGTTSTGIRPRAPSSSTSLSAPTTITWRRDDVATMRSRTSAPPQPFTRSRSGATSSAPSTVTSSSRSSRSARGIPTDRASRAVTSDVGTPVTRSPARTRVPSSATNADAVRPEPSPTRAPSSISSSARRATASTAASATTLIASSVACAAGRRGAPTARPTAGTHRRTRWRCCRDARPAGASSAASRCRRR